MDSRESMRPAFAPRKPRLYSRRCARRRGSASPAAGIAALNPAFTTMAKPRKSAAAATQWQALAGPMRLMPTDRPSIRDRLTRSELARRNYRALLLFGRAIVTTLAIVSGALGFLTGIEFQRAQYNPHSYAIGAGFLCAVACTVIAFMLYRRRVAKLRMIALEAQVEELSDKNWELHDAEMQ